MQNFPESDWKAFRELREKALERFCKRVLDEIAIIQGDESRSCHNRYLAVFELLGDRDRQLTNAFDTPRRSRMIIHLAAMAADGLIAPNELGRFSSRMRAAIDHFVTGR